MAASAAADAGPAAQLPAVTNGEAADERSPEELYREAESAFSEIFSVRAPRDVIAGMWSAAQCILSGVFFGVAGAIMQPIEGMRDSGVPGCFRGAALGLCTGLFFSLTGLCTGVFQAVRGVLATPRALCMASKGRQWDGESATWVEPKAYSLPEEAAAVLGGGEREEEEEEEEDRAGSGGRGGLPASSRRLVVDSYYYDQLSVPPTATQRDIRRAYIQQSRQWHPDKTSEPQAKERFQAISEAYQVLSDPARRRAYDAQGRQGAGEGFVDARVFFSVLLGADALEPLIGRLRLAEMLCGEDLFGSGKKDDAGEDANVLSDLNQQLRDGGKAEAKAMAQQVRREVELAVALAARLDTCSTSSNHAFKEAAGQEARGMLQKDASLERFIMEIGWVYRNRAELYLAKQGSRLGSFGARALVLRLTGRGREAQQKASTATLAVRSLFKLRKIVNEASENTAEEEADEMPSALTSALPTFMDTFWSLASHDITSTLDKVVERVLNDSSVSEAARQQRAEALRELGGAFVAEAQAAHSFAAAGGSVQDRMQGSSSSSGEQQRRRFEEAFIASLNTGAHTAE